MFNFKTVLLVASALASVKAFSGEVTWFDPGLGACGVFNTGDDYIVAMSHEMYDTFPGATPNPNLNPICGRNIRVTYQGRSVVVKVADKCGGCQLVNNVDLSPIAFRVLADQTVGRLYGAEWDWTDSAPGPA